MINKVKKLIGISGLKSTTLVVAVSGGSDSMTMLHILNQISDEFDLTIVGAHMNHNIRGKESDSDQIFVTNTFAQLNIAYEIASINIPQLSIETKKSIETIARIERLKFLSQTCLKYRASAICLGHNSNDQTETILMHIIRGTGLKGLRGMQTLSSLSIEGQKITLFRPLLDHLKCEIEEYCATNEITFVTDSTNLKSEYTRNNLRLNVIPTLMEANPSLHEAMARLSEAAISDDELIERISDEIWDSEVCVSKNMVRINTHRLTTEHMSIHHRILKRAVHIISENPPDISMSHTKSFTSLILGPSGKTLTLPRSILVKKQYGNIFLFKENKHSSSESAVDKTEIAIPGLTKINGWQIKTNISTIKPDGILPRPTALIAHLSEAAIGDRLYVRNRTNGDRFQPVGMKHSKKIQDFMVDEKIPRNLRDQIPIVVSNQGICWIVGHRVSEWAKHTNTGKAVVIQFTRDVIK